MQEALIRLTGAALLPVVLAVIIYIAERRGRFAALLYWLRQGAVGLLFGIVAMLATDFGVPIDGAVVNVRTAAPLMAGLLFGGPAGVIAGVLGGVHRYLAVYWGAGAYTRLGCALGTMLAGVIGAACRKFMFDNKKASWFYGLTIGVTTEVLHMLLLFLTHMDDIATVYSVVEICAPLMIVFNALSVSLALLVVSLIGRDRKGGQKPQRQISQTFQYMLMICVVVALVVTCAFTYALQTRISHTEADDLLRLNIDDVHQEISDVSDANLLALTHDLSAYLSLSTGKYALMSYAEYFDVAEISLIDANGVIVSSSVADHIGYDMADGAQSAEFLCLLDGETQEFAQAYQPISRDASIYRKYAGVTLPEGGFVQVGYDASRFQRDIDAQMDDVTSNRHIGQGGSLLVCDEGFNVISVHDAHDGECISREALLAAEAGERFIASVHGVECFCMYVFTEGYYIIASLPVQEAMFSRNIAVWVIAFMEVLVFAALFAQIYHLIKTLIVDNIHKINRSLAQITGGNLNVTVDVRENEEFASLSDDINSTVSALKHYIAEAEARIDQELEIGRQIQHSVLPSVFPPFPSRRDFEIFALMDAAKEVGGDFYDFFLLGDNRLVFIVADVSGKGIPGAMFMMTSKTLIKGLMESGKEIDEAFTQANRELCAGNDAGMFVTAWMGALDLTTGMLSYVNAGHNPPLIRRKNGAFEFLRTRPNFVLAGMDGVRYKRHELQLFPGDDIFLYTDGVTEATDAHNQLYGEDRLVQVLSASDKRKTDELCKTVRADIDRFVGDAPQFDDITMLCIKLNHIENANSITTYPEMASVSTVADFVEKRLEEWEVGMRTAARIQVALDEIYSNILRYSGASESRVEIARGEDCVILDFEDNGAPYDPTAAADPDVTLSAQDREIGGLGIFMVKKSTRSMDYSYADGCNRLKLVFDL